MKKRLAVLAALVCVVAATAATVVASAETVRIGLTGQNVRQAVQMQVGRDGRGSRAGVQDVYLSETPIEAARFQSAAPPIPEPAMTGLLIFGLTALYRLAVRGRKKGV